MAASGGDRISSQIPFHDVAKLLERISGAETGEKKRQSLTKFIEVYRDTFKKFHGTLDSAKAQGDSLYPILRILLPDVDRGRRAYGFKSHSLGRMFVQILGLDKTSRDAKRLTEFKDPGRAGTMAGDLGGIVFNIFKDRFASNNEAKVVKLTELHETLDKLARTHDGDVNQDQQKKILQGIVRKLSALEAKWLIRILLKELRLGISTGKSFVYGLLHKDAKTLSQRIGDLELLCQKLNDPNVEVSDADISMFHHFCPMLATRMNMIDNASEIGGSLEDDPDTNVTSKSKASKRDPVTLPHPPFYVETKWDGERFQIHYDGKDFKYFSRRAFDFTRKFGETLTPKLRPRVKGNIQSFIVDGEMMAYNKKYKIFTQKGYNIDVKTINKDNPNHCPVFVVFDLVYCNGTTLTALPLCDRRKKLSTVFEFKDDTIRLSELKTMNTKDEVIATLNSAIDDGEEGLIVKDMNSVYEPGKRLITWLKIKPEYIEGTTVDDLDLVILGAYYTESIRRGGEISHFLVGLLDKSKGTEEYYPIATVGSGRLRSIEVKGLVEELTPRFVKSSFSNVHIRSRKKPDFMINPSNSIVVQVKASEIIPSDVYSINFTLRFPRITKIRKDKNPRDVMTVQEFIRLKDDCGGKLAKRTDGGGGRGRHFYKKRKLSDDSEGETDDHSPMMKRSPNISSKASPRAGDYEDDDAAIPGPSSLLLPFKSRLNFNKSPIKAGNSAVGSGGVIAPKKFGNALVQSNLFGSKVFCVYGTSSWKSEMESNIRKHGGSISQNPVKDLFAIIGERKTSVLIQKAIQAGNYDVLEPSWINRSIEKGVISAAPLDYWAMTKTTRKQFKNDYDEFGDSYTKENTVKETKELLKRIMERDSIKAEERNARVVNVNEESNDSCEDDGNFSDGGSSTSFSESELQDKIFKSGEAQENIAWNFMSDVKIAFRGPVDFILQNKFEFYGGKVASTESEEGITHVVVSSEGSPSKKDHSRALVVTQKWLADCLDSKKELDERHYSAV